MATKKIDGGVAVKAPKARKATGGVILDFTGVGLQAAVAKAATATKAKAKAKAKAKPVEVEVVDVTSEVMGALQQQAEATKAKASKAKRLSPEQAKAVKQAHGGEFVAALEETATKAEPKAKATKAKAEPKAKATKAKAEPKASEPVVEQAKADTLPSVDAETKAADAVYAYAERLGIDIGDVVRIAKATEEYDMLVGLAGMEITDRVVWLAGQKAREFDARVVKPHSPKIGLTTESAPKAARGAAKGNGGGGKARVEVFGKSATAFIRALTATCQMSFAQIRNVLNALGADSVADATIRCQMAGGGLTRGEPATLTAEQIEKAKAAAVAVAC